MSGIAWLWLEALMGWLSDREQGQIQTHVLNQLDVLPPCAQITCFSTSLFSAMASQTRSLQANPQCVPQVARERLIPVSRAVLDVACKAATSTVVARAATILARTVYRLLL